MKNPDFRIGKEFFTASGRWLCTDIGTRTIVAVKRDLDDSSWYNGPPYAVAEFVFDEYDQEGCVKTYKQGLKAWGADFRKAEKERGKIISMRMSKKATKILKQTRKSAR